jgi:hypothetical protein
MSGKFHKVRVVNPAEKPKRKKKAMARKKASSSKRTTNPKRRRRRRSSSTTRRRRRRNPGAPIGAAPRRRRATRRRRNPDDGGGGRRGIDLMAPMRNWAPVYRLLGKAAAAWAVRKWGDPEGAVASTATMGGRWTIRNHFFGLAAGYVAGRLIGLIGRGSPQQVYDGAVDLSLSKAFWHEIIQAIPGGATYFGSTEVQQLLARANAGDTIDDGRGNRYVVQVGPDGSKQMMPMMGLQSATALDGIQAARPIDGIQTARPIDGWQTRQRMGMGHLTTDGTNNEQAAYMRRGTSDPYLAAFMGTRR